MRKDFEAYVITVQKQYTDMTKTIEKVNEQLAKGMITEESTKNIVDYYNLIKANYERIMYCRYLYNLPPKFIQKLQQKKLQKEAQKFIDENADKESVEKENQECLDNIKAEIKDEDSGDKNI